MSLVYFVEGGDTWLRNAFVRGFLKEKEAEGWRVESCVGGVTSDESIRTTLMGGIFFTEKTLLWVKKPDKVDPTMIRDQIGRHANPNVMVLLEQEGKLRKATGLFTEVVSKLASDYKREFKSPEWYKAEEHAVKVATNIAKSLNIKISSKLVKALVKAVGTDLGILNFELRKVAMISKDQEVTAEDLKQVIAPLAEVSGNIICEALATKNKKVLLRAVEKYLKTNKADTYTLISQYLQPTLLKWLQVADLLERGLTTKQIASDTGINEYYLKNSLCAPARAWGREGCLRLVCVLSRTQEATMRSVRSPFFVLLGGILEVFDT
jgi:DNA polymerase III delta subunit